MANVTLQFEDVVADGETTVVMTITPAVGGPDEPNSEALSRAQKCAEFYYDTYLWNGEVVKLDG